MFYPKRENSAALAKLCVRTCAGLCLLVFAMATALTTAVAARADERVGMLHPIGSVTVNDAAAARPVALFDGDRIATGAGTATIVSEGTQVFVPENSAVMYMQHEVVVLKNRAVITTLNGMAARAGALKISPEGNASTQFSLTREDAAATVSAISGSVSLRNAGEEMPLKSGNSMRVDAISENQGALRQNFLHPINTGDSAEWLSGGGNGGGKGGGNGGGNNGGGHHGHPPPPPPPPPRRCHRPPESPTHHCDPFFDPFHCCFHHEPGW